MPLPKLFPQELSFIGSTRQGEAPRVAFVGFDWIVQSRVTKLSSFEDKSSWLSKWNGLVPAAISSFLRNLFCKSAFEPLLQCAFE